MGRGLGRLRSDSQDSFNKVVPPEVSGCSCTFPAVNKRHVQIAAAAAFAILALTGLVCLLTYAVDSPYAKKAFEKMAAGLKLHADQIANFKVGMLIALGVVTVSFGVATAAFAICAHKNKAES